MKARKLQGLNGAGIGIMIFCPACKCGHLFTEDRWSFNGNTEKPTFRPSMLILTEKDNKSYICHSFVTDGVIQFLMDSTHDLKGKQIPLEDL